MADTLSKTGLDETNAYLEKQNSEKKQTEQEQLQNSLQQFSEQASAETSSQCTLPTPPSTSTDTCKTMVPVSAGEVCTIQSAIQYGIFHTRDFFNNKIPQAEIEKIDKKAENKSEYEYSLCSTKDDKAYKNCVLSTNNPWKTLREGVCIPPLLNESLMTKLSHNNELVNIGLTYNKDSKVFDKPAKIPANLPINKYCQDKWYDWFSIPDYHHGNRYSSVFINPEKTQCYAPCQIGYLPYTENGIENKCISKLEFDNGKYEKSFSYLPISLILLLGSTKDTLLTKHTELMTSTYTSMQANYTHDNLVYTKILTDINTSNNIYEHIKVQLRSSITELFSKADFDITNITPDMQPSEDMSLPIMTGDKILDAYNIAKYFFDLVNNSKEKKVWKVENNQSITYQQLYDAYLHKLSDINGYDISSSKFTKLITIFKKACNVSFDAKSIYSRLMFSRLKAHVAITNPNLKEDIINTTYTPFEFIIDATDATTTMKAEDAKKNNLPNAPDFSGLPVEEAKAKASAYMLDSRRSAELEKSKEDKVQLNVKTPKKYYEEEKPKLEIKLIHIVSAIIGAAVFSVCVILFAILYKYWLHEYIDKLIYKFKDSIMYAIIYIENVLNGKYYLVKLRYLERQRQHIEEQLMFLKPKLKQV